MTDPLVHVAAREEQRGRVVLEVSSATPHAIAVAAAVRIARAFGSSLESIFIEDAQLFDLAAYSFTREVSQCGRMTRGLDPADVERLLAHDERLAAHAIAAAAAAGDVPYRARVMRDEPLRALSIACAEAGPWNIVALAEPFGTHDAEMLARLMADVSGATGVLLVGPQSKRTKGPVILAIEDVARLPATLRTADRLIEETGEPIIVLLLASRADDLADLEGHARLVLGSRADVQVVAAAPAHGHEGVAAEALRRLGGGFVIAQWGGLLVPPHGSLSSLALAVECPLFLSR